ncbi:hypothetical protein, partial [uncultured Porphyromonas sp.]|uniref:hypothetical protein n=1 Tax=uncultured Porphyromonas sp. TaxID=159274 RepID=UPI0028058749
RETKNEYEVLNPSHPKETGSNEATTTNHNTILMRHPWVKSFVSVSKSLPLRRARLLLHG